MGVAAAVYDEDTDFDELVKRMEAASRDVVSGEVTYAVRGYDHQRHKKRRRSMNGIISVCSRVG